MTDKQREKIIELHTAGLKIKEIVEKTGISPATVYRLIKQIEAKALVPRTSPEEELPEEDMTADEEYLSEDPDDPPDEKSPEFEMYEVFEKEFRQISEELGKVKQELVHQHQVDRETFLDAIQRLNQECGSLEKAGRPESARTILLHLFFLLALGGVFFLMGGLCSIYDMRFTALLLVSVLGCIGFFVLTIVCLRYRMNNVIALYALGTVTAPWVLFAGYHFFLMGSVARVLWLRPLLFLPIGIGCAFLYLLKTRHKTEGPK